jgi:hypothetical protein
MSWWYKTPADAGRRPEILAVGWAGFCAWTALMGVDAQQDFGARIPRRFADPSYLASQAPPDGPAPELYAQGLERCLEKGLAAWDGHELVLDQEIYEDWRGAKSDRQRKHEERQRDRASRGVTKRHDESRDVTFVTHVTPPDQTRPDQTRPESESPAPAHTHAHAHHGPAPEPQGAALLSDVANAATAGENAAPEPPGSATTRMDAAWGLAQRHDEIGRVVAGRCGKGWRSLGTAGPIAWAAVLANGATSEECNHVLAMLSAEADERGAHGIADPLRFLRSPTSPEIWRRAVGLPDEDAAREAVSASPEARGVRAASTPPEPKRRARRLG